ncbi:MAG: polymerase sigma factor [Frankiales bacterium]|nr:polymerase sigma factor [Frankiales bacterium]
MTAFVGTAAHDGAATQARATRDELSFVTFYSEHFGRVSGYALSLVGDAGLATDVAQEAFTRLFARWARVRDPRAWVYFVATNLATDHWRRSQRDRALTHVLRDVTTHEDPAHDPWLRDLVDRLPENLRQAVLLHYYADLPVDEVARLVHRPVGTVKRRLHDARQLLASAGGTHD